MGTSNVKPPNDGAWLPSGGTDGRAFGALGDIHDGLPTDNASP
ncbi:hypothetical protein [Posidoniimonas polymericola]|nr:hypothetical protein [Posidoniimonas polymericola]